MKKFKGRPGSVSQLPKDFPKACDICKKDFKIGDTIGWDDPLPDGTVRAGHADCINSEAFPMTQVKSEDGSCIVCHEKLKFFQSTEKIILKNHLGEKAWAIVHKKCADVKTIDPSKAN